MDIIKLLVIFAVLIGVLRLKKPLYLAAALCCLLSAALFGFSPVFAARTIGEAMLRPKTLGVLLVIYLLSLMQHMMDRRGLFDLAKRSLAGLSDNLRLNMAVIPMFVGILPAPGSVLIAAPMVDEGCGDNLSTGEKAVVTSYYRHIPETWLPTYSSVIIALELSGVSVAAYLTVMAPMALAMAALGYLFFLRRLPRRTGVPRSERPLREVGGLLRGLWCILLLIVLILSFGMPVQAASLLALAALAAVGRFGPKELGPLAVKSFSHETLLGSYSVLILADVLTASGVMARLPALFERLPTPPYLTFALLFFFATLVGGMQGVLVMALPLAFATAPNPGVGLLVLLMCFGHSAMQLSPTHVCLSLATGYFGISLQELLRRTLPVVLIFNLVALGYYLLLAVGFGIG